MELIKIIEKSNQIISHPYQTHQHSNQSNKINQLLKDASLADYCFNRLIAELTTDRERYAVVKKEQTKDKEKQGSTPKIGTPQISAKARDGLKTLFHIGINRSETIPVNTFFECSHTTLAKCYYSKEEIDLQIKEKPKQPNNKNSIYPDPIKAESTAYKIWEAILKTQNRIGITLLEKESGNLTNVTKYKTPLHKWVTEIFESAMCRDEWEQEDQQEKKRKGIISLLCIQKANQLKALAKPITNTKPKKIVDEHSVKKTATKFINELEALKDNLLQKGYKTEKVIEKVGNITNFLQDNIESRILSKFINSSVEPTEEEKTDDPTPNNKKSFGYPSLTQRESIPIPLSNTPPPLQNGEDEITTDILSSLTSDEMDSIDQEDQTFDEVVSYLFISSPVIEKDIVDNGCKTPLCVNSSFFESLEQELENTESDSFVNSSFDDVGVEDQVFKFFDLLESTGINKGSYYLVNVDVQKDRCLGEPGNHRKHVPISQIKDDFKLGALQDNADGNLHIFFRPDEVVDSLSPGKSLRLLQVDDVRDPNVLQDFSLCCLETSKGNYQIILAVNSSKVEYDILKQYLVSVYNSDNGCNGSVRLGFNNKRLPEQQGLVRLVRSNFGRIIEFEELQILGFLVILNLVVGLGMKLVKKKKCFPFFSIDKNKNIDKSMPMPEFLLSHYQSFIGETERNLKKNLEQNRRFFRSDGSFDASFGDLLWCNYWLKQGYSGLEVENGLKIVREKARVHPTYAKLRVEKACQYLTRQQ